MIARITGRLVSTGPESVEVETGGLVYEVLIPAVSANELQQRIGRETTLYTVHYLEGSPAGGNLAPRLLGFLTPADREFFEAFITVKGISMRRALRVMVVPYPAIAAAIERGDVAFLTNLPEIGKKTAAQILTDLRSKVARFTTVEKTSPIEDLSDAQRVALEILVQWGDRRADAQRWVAAAVEADPGLHEPDAIVRAAYRVKAERH